MSELSKLLNDYMLHVPSMLDNMFSEDDIHEMHNPRSNKKPDDIVVKAFSKRDLLILPKHLIEYQMQVISKEAMDLKYLLRKETDELTMESINAEINECHGKYNILSQLMEFL